MHHTPRGFAIALVLFLVTSLLAACGDQPDSTAATTERAPYIVAMNNPLAYFASRIAGNDLDIRLLAPANSDPAQWQPTLEDALQLHRAELVLLNGAGYEGWPDKVAIAEHRLANTSEAFRANWLQLTGEVSHSHGPEGEHAHSGYAFTTWMDMALAQQQAEAVAVALTAKNLVRTGDTSSSLLADIKALDAAYREQGERLAGRQIIYSHPVYQYFERAYGLSGTSLHWEPDTMPSEMQWRELAAMVEPNALFVWEAKPNTAIINRMQAMGVSFVVVDPAANVADADWLSVQRRNISRLQQTP